MKQHYMVSEEQEDLRIDRYLSEACEELSRSYIQKLLKNQDVLVNGGPVKASYKVAAGDQIEVDVPEAVEPEIVAEEMDLDILYEDQDVILVNKPKGMVVHPAAGHYTGTLVNGLMAHCRDELSGINGVMRPGIIHRIDMDTTGVLIVCKNDFAHNSIAAQLKEHSITRKYRAIVYGVIKEDEGTVDAPIGRHPVDRKKMSINEKNGRHAVTHYRVLKRFSKYTYGQHPSSSCGRYGLWTGEKSFPSAGADPSCRCARFYPSKNRGIHGIYSSIAAVFHRAFAEIRKYVNIYILFSYFVV